MTVTPNQLNATTREILKDKDVKSLVTFGDSLLWALWRGSRFEEGFVTPDMTETYTGGIYVKNLIRYELSHRGGRGAATRMIAERKETITDLRFTIGGLYSSSLIDLDDERKNKGEAAMVKLTEDKINNILDSVQDILCVNLLLSRADMVTYANGLYPAKQYSIGDFFEGLSNTFVTGNPWGNQTEANVSVWDANLYASALTFNYSGVNKLLEQARIGDGINAVPDYVFTPHLICVGYKNSLQTQQQFRDEEMANAGFTFVMHDHRTHIVGNQRVNDHISSSTALALNMSKLHLVTDPDTAFPFPVWKEIDPLQPHTKLAYTEWDGAVIDDRRNAHVKANSVSAAA